MSFCPLLFSPDNRKLLLGGREWDLVSGEQTARLGDDMGWNWAAFSPDGQQLIFIQPTGEVMFLELGRKGSLAGSRNAVQQHAHQDFGRAVVFSPDGKLAASASETIVLWDAATRTKLGRFEYDSIVWGLSFSPDGRWLVSTHGDGAVLVWNIDERRREASLNGHSDAVRTIAFSPDGSRFVSAGEDRSVIVWNASSGAKEAVFNGHRTRVVGAAFSPDGQWLASTDQDAFVIRWDLDAKAARWRVPGTSRGSKNVCMTVSPDGRWIATRQGVFDSATGEQIIDWDYAPNFGGLEGGETDLPLADPVDHGLVPGRHIPHARLVLVHATVPDATESSAQGPCCACSADPRLNSSTPIATTAITLFISRSFRVERSRLETRWPAWREQQGCRTGLVIRVEVVRHSANARVGWVPARAGCLDRSMAASCRVVCSGVGQSGCALRVLIGANGSQTGASTERLSEWLIVKFCLLRVLEACPSAPDNRSRMAHRGRAAPAAHRGLYWMSFREIS